MNFTILLKAVTLCFFVSCIAGFVLYRSGYFSKSDIAKPGLQTSSNGGAVPVDSLLNKRLDSTAPLLLSSSKTIILADKYRKRDTTKRKKVDNLKTDSSASKRRMLMSSSKSMKIIEPSSMSKEDSVFYKKLINDKPKQ